jgi:CHRD domain
VVDVPPVPARRAIVVPLTPPSTGDPGASSGCVTVDPALARAILNHPHRYYANVHTTAFPNGAARGQLFARSR